VTLREAATSALAGPARERASDVARRSALCPDARQKQDRARQQAPGLADRARMRRADNGADARQPVLADEVLAPLRNHPRDVLPEHTAVAERHVLDVRYRPRSRS